MPRRWSRPTAAATVHPMWRGLGEAPLTPQVTLATRIPGTVFARALNVKVVRWQIACNTKRDLGASLSVHQALLEFTNKPAGRLLWINPSGAETVIFRSNRINTMAADALADVARSSATMVLIIQNKWVVGLNLVLRPAKERRRYKIPPFLIDWVQT